MTPGDPEQPPAGPAPVMTPHRSARAARNIRVFALTLLAIEFLDELVFGVREAAWPLIRDDLALSYAQVGLLLGLPGIASSLIEPFLGILGDVWRRRVLVLGGGLAFAISLLITALSHNFLVLLASFVLFYPASGAFVSLSQATLMDADPSRHEQNMARWTFAGSLGVVGGTLLVAAAARLALDWRVLYLLLAGLTLLVILVAWRMPFPSARPEDEEQIGFRSGVAGALRALKRREVLRWLMLLQFSDFMVDVLLGYLALYFVDVVHAKPEDAALAVTVWTVVGLAGDFLLIPLLERVRGLSYLRVSAALELALFAGFLLAPYVWAKFVLLGLLGLFNAGWYSILQGRLYSAMPGQSGTVMAVSNVSGLAGSLLPLALGFVAQRFGLQSMMWLLLAGPVALLVGLPRDK
jgi:FSR family fosmidomycin resistance protein-like MFS transporter